jgi:hypothetical protein
VAATFYNDPHAGEHGTFVRLPQAELNLGNAAPANGVGAENFFVRMGGRIRFPAPGEYTFSIEGAAEDDVELFLNGSKVLAANRLKGAAMMPKAIVVSDESTVDYRLEYRHRTGSGMLRLLWESQEIPRQPVPPEALQDAWGRFITNEGKPSDWWLKLTRMGKEMMNGKRDPDSPMP